MDRYRWQRTDNTTKRRTDDVRRFLSEAWDEGNRRGRADRTLGYRSGYAWHGVMLETPDTYHHQFSLGYRAGWHAAEQEQRR